jgi:hypothetical protein
MNRPGRRGFAVIVALVLVALVGAAALAVTSILAADARRTWIGEEDARLRQILLAGAATMKERAIRWPATPEAADFAIALPGELGEANGSLRVRVEPAGAESTIDVEISARLNHRLMRQSLAFRRIDGRWRAVSAAIEPGVPIRPKNGEEEVNSRE